MTTPYITKAGDTVDSILWAHLASTHDALEAQFWALNKSATAFLQSGVHFPQGVVVHVPAPTAAIVEVTSPWD